MAFDEYGEIEAAKTKILVIGVGGGGNNAINHMIENDVRGVEFIAVNTDAQVLRVSQCENRLLIGKTRTHGQGAGANPDVGREAALENEDDIHEMIGDAEMVFITCGMGGGTGTGAAPVIARIAREHGCLTIGVCTKPFGFEGPDRMNNAVKGLEEIRQYVDTLVVISNQRLLNIVSPHTPVTEAFREADNVLRQGVQGIAEIISMPGLINIDFADFKTVMANKGTALMGIGSAKGPNRAIEAARRAIKSSLLEVSIDGATDAIINITASSNLSLSEVDEAIAEIRNNCGKNLNIIYGTAFNDQLGEEIVITVVATGYELKAQSYGYDDLAERIYNNMADTQINYESLRNEAEEKAINNTNNKIDEIFSTPSNKIPKGVANKEKKENKKNNDVKLNKNDDGLNPKKSNMPSWLKLS